MPRIWQWRWKWKQLPTGAPIPQWSAQLVWWRSATLFSPWFGVSIGVETGFWLGWGRNSALKYIGDQTYRRNYVHHWRAPRSEQAS